MRWTAFVFFSAVICELAIGQDKYVESQVSFLTIPPPATLKWQLATASGEDVVATIENIPAQTFGGGQIHYDITPENAPEFGVDFAAWQIAVNDPAYNRSIITFGDMTQEAPVVRTGTDLELDYLRIFLDNYRWPVPTGSSTSLTVTVFATDAAVVPEPHSLFMAAIAILALPIRPRSRFREYRCRRTCR
jgi:hypothetical protein